jgi:hypothetical protein
VRRGRARCITAPVNCRIRSPARRCLLGRWPQGVGGRWCRRPDSQGLLPGTGGLTPNCPALPTDPRGSADSNRSALLIDLTPVTDGHDNNQQDPITDGVDDSIVPNSEPVPITTSKWS